MTDFSDKTIVCVDCGQEFVWTAREQAFYEEKGFENAPKKCFDCRKKAKANFRRDRQMFKAVCAKCGQETEVPFEPKEGRPVYCIACFKQMKQQEE